MLIISRAACVAYPHSAVIVKGGVICRSACVFAVKIVGLRRKAAKAFIAVQLGSGHGEECGADYSVIVRGSVHKACDAVSRHNGLLYLLDMEAVDVWLAVFVCLVCAGVAYV